MSVCWLGAAFVDTSLYTVFTIKEQGCDLSGKGLDQVVLSGGGSGSIY